VHPYHKYQVPSHNIGLSTVLQHANAFLITTNYEWRHDATILMEHS